MASPPRRVAFFSLPAQRKEPKERAALPLRRPRSPGRGTGGARTRCAQTACPFFPVPHPAARLSAKGPFFIPGDPSCPEPSSWRGQRSYSWRGILRAIVPTLQRGNGVVTLPRHWVDGERDCGRWRYRGQPGRIEKRSARRRKRDAGASGVPFPRWSVGTISGFPSRAWPAPIAPWLGAWVGAGHARDGVVLRCSSCAAAATPAGLPCTGRTPG